jgi:3-oxoacyl-[acyl-carrier-protein] synthase II
VHDDSPLPAKTAGWIDDAALAAALAPFGVDDPDRSSQLALYAVGQALQNAGLPTDGTNPIEADVIVGTGHGNVGWNHRTVLDYQAGGYRKIRPTSVLRIMFNRPANIASIRYRLIGASHVVSAACATGSVAFGEAFQRIRGGLSEMVIAACEDTGLDETSFAVWNRLGVLSKIPDPAAASRPFDARRDGLVMGEGAAGFVLESLESAQRRGARIRAEVVSYACTSDATHIVQPNAAGQVRAIERALQGAGLRPAQIDYVNAHGTATELADIVESESLRQVFGPDTDAVPVSNTKAQLGHLMGATAGVELVVTMLALEHQVIPPCRNLDDPDPRCPLNFVRGQPLARGITHVLKNSFAFGGTNCAIVLRRWP